MAWPAAQVRRSGAVLAAMTFTLTAAPALAGPPYATDDPAPTDLGHWEIYAYAGGTHVDGATAGEGGLDLNYGAAKDLQLTLVVPAAYQSGDDSRLGRGTVELAAKLRLLHEDSGWRPDVAVFPRLFLPTASRGLGSDRVGLLLPVWVGKDFGAWSVFGGGGYQINPGADQRSYWTGGLALTRSLGERFSVGGEVYARGRDSVGGKAFVGVNVGGTWKVARHWSLLAAGGPGVLNAADEGRYAFYVALKADY
jgi:hypothetical protein